MRVGASRSQLYDAQKTARAQWAETCTVWDDAARQSFEETTWEPLDQHASELLRAIDQLSVLFAQVRAECEFPG
jgi:hypothetical protein